MQTHIMALQRRETERSLWNPKAMYSFGAPAVSDPAMPDLNQPDRCFRGLRTYTDTWTAWKWGIHVRISSGCPAVRIYESVWTYILKVGRFTSKIYGPSFYDSYCSTYNGCFFQVVIDAEFQCWITFTEVCRFWCVLRLVGMAQEMKQHGPRVTS